MKYKPLLRKKSQYKENTYLALAEDERWYAEHPGRIYRLRLPFPDEEPRLTDQGPPTHVIVIRQSSEWHWRESLHMNAGSGGMTRLPDSDELLAKLFRLLVLDAKPVLVNKDHVRGLNEMPGAGGKVN